MANIIEMQSPSRCAWDDGRVCGYHIDIIEAPTTPLIHQAARIWYIREGRGTVKLQEREYKLGPGYVVSILPWQISEIVRVEEPLICHYIVYHFDSINHIIKYLYNVENEELPLIRELENSPVVSCTEKQQRRIAAIFDQIRDEMGQEEALEQQDSPGRPDRSGLSDRIGQSDRPGQSDRIGQSDRPRQSDRIGQSDAAAREPDMPLVINKVVELVLQIHRMGRQNSPDFGAPRQDIQSSEILPYIYGHLSEKITLKSLSGRFFMSETAISQYITNTTGLTFFDLLSEMRVAKTINYLLYTDLTLEELAEILGFVDSAHISKVFAARLGMRANEYRQTYQKVNEICRVKENPQAYHIVSYLYRNYDKELSAKDVAEEFQLNVRELNRTLLYQVEKNFTDFVNFIRVNRACELLARTDLGVTEVAVEVGFRNSKTLTRNFLKFRLMTPGQFRTQVELQPGPENMD